MMLGWIIRRAALPVLLAGPVLAGLPAGAGLAAVMGALVGLAAVLPIAIVLRLVPLRTVFGWPFLLLRVVMRR